MSGHSRWSQIRHKKGVTDQKKGQIFSKLAKIISIAARQGTDPATNNQLRTVMERARELNMPKENIERAIKRASEKETVILNEVVIQAIALGSVAIVIKAITDNKNRTISEIKNILIKNQAKMVPEGSLNWMFAKGWQPHSPVRVETEEDGQKLEKLFDELDDHDDVENIYSNLK